MSAGPHASADAAEWAERLAACAEDADGPTWRAFDAVPAALRAEVAEALRQRVMTAVRTAPPEALALSERLLRAARGLDELEALVQRARAVALHFNGRSREAAAPFERALAWYEARGEALEAARVRRSLVDVYQMSGDSERALAVADAARATFVAHGEQALLAQLECNVGNVYFRLDRYGDARAHYERAAEVFEAEGDAFGRAYALFNLGNIETNAHRFDEATRCYELAQPAFRAGGHEVLAVDCDYSTGYLDLRRGRLSDAHRALTRAREGYLAGGKPSGPALCDLDLCELSLRIDAYRDAVRHGERALEELEGLDLDYERAKARLLVGIALGRLGEARRASEALAAASAALGALGNRTLAALATLHRVPLEQGERDAATLLVDVEAAARDLDASGDELLAQLGSLARAEALLRARRRDEGVAELERLARRAAPEGLYEQGLANARIEGLRLLAAASLEDGDRARAEELLRDAVGWIEATLEHLSHGDARVAFFAQRQPAFAELAGLLLDARGAEGVAEALALVERSRLRSAREQRSAPPSEEVRALRERLDVLLREDLEERLDDPGREAHRRGAALARAELGNVREELLRLQRAESGAHAAGRAARVALERVDLGRLGPRERVLYYLEARGVLHGVLLAGAPGGVRVLRALRLDVSARGVEAELTRLRFQVQKYRHGRDYVARHSAHVQRAFERVLQELGRALVAPFLDPSLAGEALRDGDALVVVPYGALHEVPFAGLAVDGRALVERVDVSLARSLGQLRADAGVARRAVLSCLGAAEDLPEVERERAAFDAWGALEACDVDAFLARLAGGVEGAVLHLAAHGSYEPQHPLFSGVRLGARHLTAFDIARLALPECLVLLSGCETGRQANPRGEELYGPEQAFFRAGARGVVSCLWPVADSAGASFVAELARALDEGLDVRAATSRAQRVAAGRGAPPQDWAGFVYAGDPGLRLAAR